MDNNGRAGLRGLLYRNNGKCEKVYNAPVGHPGQTRLLRSSLPLGHDCCVFNLEISFDFASLLICSKVKDVKIGGRKDSCQKIVWDLNLATNYFLSIFDYSGALRHFGVSTSRFSAEL